MGRRKYSSWECQKCGEPIGWLGRLLFWLHACDDPVRHCDVYKAEGCAHVDGFLCDMKTCKILADHRAAAAIARDAGKGE
jgi:hypothetical protein